MDKLIFFDFHIPDFEILNSVTNLKAYTHISVT